MAKFIDEQGLQLVWDLAKQKLTNLAQGVYYEGAFYTDDTHTEVYVPYKQKLYVDLTDQSVYAYDGEQYTLVGQGPKDATSTEKGISKLYDSLGTNTDGSIIQKTVTEELDKKVELELGDDETLIFNI